MDSCPGIDPYFSLSTGFFVTTSCKLMVFTGDLMSDGILDVDITFRRLLIIKREIATPKEVAVECLRLCGVVYCKGLMFDKEFFSFLKCSLYTHGICLHEVHSNR